MYKSSKRHRSTLSDVPEDSQVSSLQLFCNVVSNLSEEQKAVVRGFGFGSLLDFCCSYVPSQLFFWLVDQFDVDSRTLNLASGFSFTLNDKCVHKLLRIPNGNRKIFCKGTAESFLYMSEQVPCKGRTPSVYELASMVTPDLVGQQFGRVFLLFALCSFLCPNTRAVCSSRYYLPLVDLSSVHELDWCSFTLDWFVSYVKKYKSSHKKANMTKIGGCSMLLLLCYLEFLSTPAFSFSLDIPRLQIWSTTTVSAFALLDSVPGSSNHFGNLELKHICCTPFKDCFVDGYSPYALPEDVMLSVMNNFSAVSRDIVISNLQKLSFNLCTSLASTQAVDSTSVVSSYIDNVLRLICTEISHGRNFLVSPYCGAVTLCPETDSDTEDSDFPFEDDLVKRAKIPQVLRTVDNSALHSFKDVFQLLPVPKLCSEHQCHEYICAFFENCQSEMLLEPDFFGHGLPDSEELYKKIFPEIYSNDDFLPNNSMDEVSTTYLMSLGQDFNQCGPSKREEHVDTKFLEDFIASANLNIDDMVAKERYKFRHTYVYDAEGRLIFPMGSATKSSSSAATVDHNFPNFNIFDDLAEVPSSLLDSRKLDNCSDDVKSLPKAFVDCNELINSVASNVACEVSNPPNNLRNEKLVISLDIESKFYHLLTDSIINYGSPRIVQYNTSWVDQRTLSLSMMPGGWINTHVMDAFCKMFSSAKSLRGCIPRNFFTHATSVILMTPLVDHDCYKIDFLECAGLNLQKGLLVHIPCYYQNQWFLVTVNFDAKKFDILNPDYNADNIQTAVNSVVYNFRKFFIRLFPTLKMFNIRDFSVRYIFVPKFNFRYDSGVFVLYFLKTYNGNSVEKFSNADIPAIREKLLFELCFNRSNRSTAPILKEFRRNNAQFFQ